MNIIKGLILKDLLQLKSYWKTLIIYTGIFILAGALQQSQEGINVMSILMLTFGFGMFAMASFNYDEQAKADSYLLSFPLSKEQIVLARYILVILATLIGAIVGIIFCIVINLITNSQTVFPDVTELAYTAIGGIFGVSIVEAIQIPCAYKWGAEKGRIHLFIVAAAIILGVIGLLTIAQNSNFNFAINEIIYLMGGFFPIFLILLTAIIYYVSYKFSFQIYENKE
mgnify:CR=1 FL=1